MKKILKKLDKDDFIYISERLDSHVSFTRDAKRKKIIGQIKEKPTEDAINIVDKQIRYFASSDIASACRKALGKESYVSADTMLDDIINKMKFNINKHLPLEDKCKRIVTEIVRKEMVNAKPEELEKMLNADELNFYDISEIIHLIEKDEGDVVVTMIEHLGYDLATDLIFSIIKKTILIVAGETAVRILVGQFFKRNPGLQAFGPIVWVLTGAWLAFDLQNTAYRKTIPICLYIGMKLISQDVEEKAKLKQEEEDRYNNLENEATQKIIKENEELKNKYKELISEKEIFEENIIQEKNQKELHHNKEIQKILDENEQLRINYNNLVLKNSKLQKLGIKKQIFEVGQNRGFRDVFSGAIGAKADKMIIQESYIRGKEHELDNLLRQFLNLNIIKPKTEITFISMFKYGDNTSQLYREMNPKLKEVCAKYDLVFNTLKLRRNNEVHSRFFIFENSEMLIEHCPDHSFYNLTRRNFAFRVFEEIIFK